MYETIDDLKQDFKIKIYNNEINLLEFKDTKFEIIIPGIIDEMKIIKISSLCFLNSNIKKIEFQELIEFEENSFVGCDNLLEIKLKDIVKNEKKFIKDCPNLKTNEPENLTIYLNNLNIKTTFHPFFELKDNIIRFREGFGIEDIKSNLLDFSFFDNIKNIQIIDNFSKKEQYEINSNIEKVILPNKLKKLSPNCFFNFSNLKDINLENIEVFEANCLYGCPIDLNLINWKKVKKLSICPFGRNETKMKEIFINFKLTNHSLSFLNIEKVIIGDKFEFYKQSILMAGFSPFCETTIKNLFVSKEMFENEFLNLLDRNKINKINITYI